MPCKTDRCRSGRRECPTPMACFGEYPDECADLPPATPEQGMDWTAIAMAVCAAAIAVCGFMAALTFNH